MSQIETEYNGVHIRYSENEDMWRCDVMDFSAKTLSALKSKISKWLAEARRVGNVPAIIVSEYGSASGKEVHIVLKDDSGKSVWCVSEKTIGGRAAKTAREKIDLCNLVADTPENRSAMDAAKRKRAEADKLAREAREIEKAIPRLTFDAIDAIPTKDASE